MFDCLLYIYVVSCFCRRERVEKERYLKRFLDTTTRHTMNRHTTTRHTTNLILTTDWWGAEWMVGYASTDRLIDMPHEVVENLNDWMIDCRHEKYINNMK